MRNRNTVQLVYRKTLTEIFTEIVTELFTDIFKNILNYYYYNLKHAIKCI